MKLSTRLVKVTYFNFFSMLLLLGALGQTLEAGNLQLIGSRIIKDGEFPGVTGQGRTFLDSLTKGARVQLYLKNVGASSVTVTGYLVNGKTQSQLKNDDIGSHVADSRWWIVWPATIAPNQITTLRIRLIDWAFDLAPNPVVTVQTSLGNENFTVTTVSTKLWIPYIAFAANMRDLTIYAANQGTTSLRLPASGGLLINNSAVSYTLPSPDIPPGKTAPLTASLGTALAAGSHFLIQLTLEDGSESAFGGMRAFPSNYGVTYWGYDEPDTADVDKHFGDTGSVPYNRMQDEPIGSNISPMSMVSNATGRFGSSQGTRQMSQFSGYEENLVYGDIVDIGMMHESYVQEDLALFLTWPKPIWYLPQDAWGRQESVVWQYENWYRLEDYMHEGMEGLGHGAKSIQWFTFNNLFEQGYDWGGGDDITRNHQDFYMPGTMANPVEWDRVGRVSGVMHCLHNYMPNSAPYYRYKDAAGLEINAILGKDTVSSEYKMALFLVDQASPGVFYDEGFPVHTQTIFTDKLVTVQVPKWLTPETACLIDPFTGVSSLAITRTPGADTDTISFTVPRVRSGAAVLLGNAADFTTLGNTWTAVNANLADYSDQEVETLTVPETEVVPASWRQGISSGTNELWDIDESSDGANILLAHGRKVYLINNQGVKQWVKEWPGRVFYAKFSRNNDLVYVAANASANVAANGDRLDYTQSTIYCYTLAGTLQWSQKAGTGAISDTALQGMTVFALESGPNNGVIYSLLTKNGSSPSSKIISLNSSGGMAWQSGCNNYPVEMEVKADGSVITCGMLGWAYITAGGVSYSTSRPNSSTMNACAMYGSGSMFAVASDKVYIYNSSRSLITSVYVGRYLRKLKFSPDVKYLAVGTCDGIFKLLSANTQVGAIGSVKFESRQKSSYISDLDFLPDSSGVLAMREYFAYSPSTHWRWRDSVDMFDLLGNLVVRHEGKWRSQPHMGLFEMSADGGTLFLGTNQDIRMIDWAANPVSNTYLYSQSMDDLSPEWQHADIGSVGSPGLARYASLDSSYIVNGSGFFGTDNNASVDKTHFLYKQVRGNCQITARILSAQRTDSYSDVGVMIRDSLAENARYIHVGCVPAQTFGLRSYHRSASPGGTTENWISGGGALPVWVRINRTGNTMTVYTAPDGLTWTQRKQVTNFSMNNDVLIGLWACSNNDGLAEGTLDNVEAQGEDGTPPSVPQNLQVTGRTETTVGLSWAGSSDNVAVTGYRVFRNGSSVGTTAGTAYTVSSLNPGTVSTFTVAAYDAGANQSSPSGSITAQTRQFPDINRDNMVDSGDLTTMVTYWLRTGPTLPGDINADEGVDLLDFAYLSGAWTGPDLAAPTAPTSLAVGGVTSTSISLSWNASSDNAGVSGYRIYRNGGTTPLTSVAGTSYTDSGLAAETAFSYQVSAYDTAGNESGLSNQVTATTTPTPPLESFFDGSTAIDPGLTSNNAMEVGVRFRADKAGLIRSIRFYRSVDNAVGYDVHLWSNSGTLLASGHIAGGTTGWLQVDFATPVAIAANTPYVASYFTSVGQAQTKTDFYLSGITNGSLYAYRDGEAGGNGIYIRLGTSAFPNATWMASTYYVDVVFQGY